MYLLLKMEQTKLVFVIFNQITLPKLHVINLLLLNAQQKQV